MIDLATDKSDMQSDTETSKKKTGFKPKHKHSGSRKSIPNKATVYRDTIALIGIEQLQEDAKIIYDKMKALCLGNDTKGDIGGCKHMLDRILPNHKKTLVRIGIRKIKGIEELGEAYDMVFAKVDDQELSLEEAQAICSMLESRAKVVEFAQTRKEMEELKLLCEGVIKKYAQ